MTEFIDMNKGKDFKAPFEPDVDELIEVLKRKTKGGRVHHLELFLDDEIKEQICEHFGIGEDIKADEPFANLKRDIQMHKFLGYDAFRVGMRKSTMFTLLTLSGDNRDWANEHAGPIQSWEDFEKYPWPEVSGLDFSSLEYLEENLPSNMGCYEFTAHILEMLMFLLGYESLCFKIFDEPDLIDAICERVGSFYVDFTKKLCSFNCVKFIWAADDMGFRSGTLVSPDFLREKILPWHKKYAQITHENNRLYLLHCCGNIEAIMDDLIDDVGLDAKHSFEDAIIPVTEAKKKYGDRLSLIGGIDVDFLCRADEKSIRKRVRETLEVCLQGGGYCLGSGNSIANYVPVENYLVMLDEGRHT